VRATPALVVVGRAASAPRLFSMAVANRAGARLATQHLLDAGQTRIAWGAALVVEGEFTESGGLRAVEQLRDARIEFTAFFAANDQMAIAAALALYRRGLRVPDDVSLVGFDDFAPARYAIPPLTTIRQSVYPLGCQAAVAMLELLHGRTPQVRLPDPELVLRESTRRRLA